MKCQICDKGEVVEKEEKNHKAMVLGQELTIPEAIVGRCDTCGAVNYAFRKEIIKGGMVEQESYTCPKCGMTSYHPDDIKHEYCAKCHKTRRELEMEDYLKDEGII
ncbi:hypothetical protein ES703_87165 [subsurface metagenome]